MCTYDHEHLAFHQMILVVDNVIDVHTLDPSSIASSSIEILSPLSSVVPLSLSVSPQILSVSPQAVSVICHSLLEVSIACSSVPW